MSETFSNMFRRDWKLEWKWDDIEWLENCKKKNDSIVPSYVQRKKWAEGQKRSSISIRRHAGARLLLYRSPATPFLTLYLLLLAQMQIEVSWAGVNDAQQNRLAQTMDSCFF